MISFIKTHILAALTGIIIFVPILASADETDQMPNLLNGQLTITSGGQQFFDGLGGNQAVINWQGDFIFDLNNSANLACSGLADLTLVPKCLILGGPTNSLGLMTSRTFRNGTAEIETATLFYPRFSAVGDIYGNPSGLSNFSRFGKHLYQGTSVNPGGIGDYWKVSNYKFNPSAQSYWNASDPNKNSTMTDTINRLSQNSKGLLANNVVSTGNNWIMRPFDGICGNVASSCSEKNQYPDGRVWKNSPGGWGLLVNSPAVTYQNKSTIIAETGTVQINTSLNRSSGNNNASLGIIVKNGDVLIQNISSPHRKMTIFASFFVPNGNIQVSGQDIDLVGSFVAKDFIVQGLFASPANNINFVQDTREESTWPPGFRDLQPLSSQSK